MLRRLKSIFGKPKDPDEPTDEDLYEALVIEHISAMLAPVTPAQEDERAEKTSIDME